MRDIFTPLFITVLALLFMVDGAPANPFIFMPLAVTAFVLFLVLFFLRKYRLAYVAVVLALTLLFAGSFLRQKDAFARDRDMDLPTGEYISLRGTLAAYPEIGSDSSRLLLQASSISWPGGRIARRVNVSIQCRGDCRRLNRGDRVEAAVKIQPRQLNRNFFPNSFEKYLLYKQLHLNGHTKSAQLVQVTARANPFWRAIGAWRGRIRAAIEARYLKNGSLQPAGVFLEATVLGDRGRLEAESRERLIGSGVFHLLAISGANIGMLALFALLLCRWLRVPLKLRYALTSMLLLLYLTVSGFDISAVRAVLMALLLFAARAAFMDVVLSNVISFCGLLLLAFNPSQFLDPGFVLTFALTAALLAGRQAFLPLLRRLPRGAAELLTANFSASLMSLPLALHFFQRYSFSGFFSGLLLVPLTGAVTVCGAMLLLLAPLSPNLARLAVVPAGWLLDVFFAVSGWFSAHAPLNIFRPSPPLPLVAAVGLLFCMLALKKIKGRWKVFAGLLLALLLLVISLPPRPYRPQRLEAYFLDVGHGDAQAVVFPGGDALLIDGGGSGYSDFQAGRRLVLPFILQKRIRVRWVAVSHFHPDHARGLAEIVAILAPEELWLSTAVPGDGNYDALLGALPGRTRIRKVTRGFAMRVGGVTVDCLSPTRFAVAAAAENDQSMVLRIGDGRASFLFCGDIEKEAEAGIVARDGPGPMSSVIKVPHHGSRTSSSAAFLDAVRPGLAVISVPVYSSYGFPSPEIIGRLRARRIRWLSTARRGGIMVAPSPAGLTIDVSK
jgi:competence protein ComEC